MQVRLFGSADILLISHGAATANLIFLPPRAGKGNLGPGGLDDYTGTHMCGMHMLLTSSSCRPGQVRAFGIGEEGLDLVAPVATPRPVQS